MLAPQPVVSPRGTPLSVRDRCRLLSELGHEVELLTFPLGQDFALPGLTIRRLPRLPGLRRLPIGFSWTKVLLDGLLFAITVGAIARRRPDLLYTHEEAGMIGAVLGCATRVPHLFDMHSSLPQQFENYRISSARPVLAFMAWAERTILKNASAVVTVCPALVERAAQVAPGVPVTLVENLSQFPEQSPDAGEVARWRSELGGAGAFIATYTGTFEANQGLDAMVEAFARVAGQIPDAVLVLAGGEGDQVKRMAERCAQLGVAGRCRLPGRVGEGAVPALLAASDVVLSPRWTGTNTPLKIYTYRDAGVAILATRIAAHTQVLDDTTALLVEPSIEGLAAGLLRLHGDSSLCTALAREARRQQQTRSRAMMRERLAHAVALAHAGRRALPGGGGP
jgi:glycosyltransferase involved in cell wall biosynthesis